MSTISSTLRMNDLMTNVFQKMTDAMYTTLDTMDKLQGSMDQAFDDSSIDAARRSILDVENALKNLSSPIEDAEKEQERFNETIKEGEKKSNNLLKTITGFVGAYLGFRSIHGFMSASYDAANDQIRAEQRLQSIMKQINGMTQDGIDLVKNYAKEIEDAMGVASNVGIFGQSQLAQYVYDPQNIKDMTTAMYNLATETYGVGFSQDQLMQTANLMGKVMMGDINALSRNGFKIDAIFDEAQQQMLKTGTEAERAALVIEMIEENLGGLAEAMRNTPEGTINALANSWGSVQEKIGYGVMPLITKFSNYITANMPTIEAIFLNVFGNIIGVIENLMTVAMNAATFIVENWSWIAPVMWGIVAAVTAYLLIVNAVTIATRVAAAAQAVWNAIMNLNPIFLIITLILGLIVALVRLWQTNDDFAAGFMRVWNNILNFFNQIPIFFTKIGFGISDALDTARVKSVEVMQGLANGVIDTINWLTDKLNSVFGLNIKVIEHLDYAATEAAAAEARKQARKDIISAMEDNAAKKAEEREQKVLDMLADRAAKREEEERKREEMFVPPDYLETLLGGGNDLLADDSIEDIERVGEVGRIKDDVNIASEDLKTMRELAEMKNIQNFVTLTPQLSFGDTHVRQDGRSIDEIVSNIAERMEQELVASARGVYDV